MAAGSDPENPLEAACGFSPPCQGLWGMTCPQIVTGLGCKSHNQSVKGRKEEGNQHFLDTYRVLDPWLHLFLTVFLGDINSHLRLRQ